MTSIDLIYECPTEISQHYVDMLDLQSRQLRAAIKVWGSSIPQPKRYEFDMMIDDITDLYVIHRLNIIRRGIGDERRRQHEKN